VTSARKALIGKALVYLNRLAPGSGGDISLQRELIDGYSKVGDLQGNLYGPNLGSAAEAKESYSRALRIAESVAAADPGSVRSRIDIAQVKMKLVDLMSLGSARKEALDKYREAEAVFQPLANSDARAQRNLMEVARRIGFTQYQLGDMNAALKSYERYVQLAGVFFSSDRQSPEARRAEAYGYERIGYITARSGAVPAGLEKMRRALRTYEELAAINRTDSMAQRDVANTYTIIGDVLAFNGKNIEAAEGYRKALAVNTAQAQDDPRNQQCQRDLHNTLVRLADVLAKAHQNTEARAMTDRALKVLQPMVESAEASEYDLQQYCYLLLTTQFADLRNPALARQYAQKLVDRSGGQDPRMLDLLASAHDAAGDPAKAVEVESKALELLPHNGASDLRAEMEKFLQGFRARAVKRKNQP
jgi:tetratricopeptide (TPR) repeat protein